MDNLNDAKTVLLNILFYLEYFNRPVMCQTVNKVQTVLLRFPRFIVQFNHISPKEFKDAMNNIFQFGKVDFSITLAIGVFVIVEMKCNLIDV